MEEQDLCKTCGGKLIVKQTRRSSAQLQKPYYYTAYYYCPNCQKLYHDDKFKVVNQSLFDDGIALSKERPHPDPLLKGEGEKRKALNGEGTIKEKDFDIEIWTDGACVFNGQKNARAAWAFVSKDTERAGLVVGKQTNNVAEALAIYYALEWASEQGFKHIKIYTDSQISLYNLQKPVEKVLKNKEIFEAIAHLIQTQKLQVTFEKVLGHSGDFNNERADQLANSLASKK